MDLRVPGCWHTRAMRYASVRDGLFARAVVVRRGGRTACIAALDLIGDAVGISAEVCRRITMSLGIPASHVMAACTHTHTSPESIGLSGHPVAAEWIEFVAERVDAAARQAAANLKPCRLELTRGRRCRP